MFEKVQYFSKERIDFFTSDWHLFHTNIIKYCNRPFDDVVSMHEVLIKNYNERMSKDSIVIFMGDMAFVKSEYAKPIIEKLNGYKILFRGNHDRSIKAMLEAGFNEVYTGWKDWKYKDKIIRLSHYPFGTKTPSDNCDYLICGHVHEKFKTQNNMINVSVDAWDFKPVSIEQIEEFLLMKVNF